MAEQIIAVQSEISKQKEFSNKMKTWVVEARRERKVFCATCARYDFDKGNLSHWKDYVISSDPTSKVAVYVKGPLGSQVRTGENWDFKCPNGHGCSVEWSDEELKTLEKKKE